MDYVRLGRSGLTVSRLCLGCMSYGRPDGGTHPWSLDEESSRPFIREALEAGITFFDTANMYSGGASEEILGRALRDFAKRDEVVIATKAFFPMKDRPNSGGLSRKALLQAAEDSLRRLGTDYIDLYQIHRWDYGTPVEESLEALHDLVKSGKVRYLGASSMYAWQLCKALGLAEYRGWTRFVSMQPHLNLLYREEEREMLPLCAEEGLGVIPWSPLARGRLARPAGAEATDRAKRDEYGKKLYSGGSPADAVIVERVEAVAKARGEPMAAIALAWLLGTTAVTAPIVGATKPGQLGAALRALSVSLGAEERASLEEPYLPRPVLGHS